MLGITQSLLIILNFLKIFAIYFLASRKKRKKVTRGNMCRAEKERGSQTLQRKNEAMKNYSDAERCRKLNVFN